MPSPKNFLICFDAFGTIFAPRVAVHKQYADVARSLGLTGFSNEEVLQAFKKSFKQKSQLHPNYGKKAGMNAETWWTEVIQDTFRPIIGSDKALPVGLAPQLLHRFRTSEGYTLMPGAGEALQALRKLRKQNAHGRKVAVGVITNSDNRVPDILTSLGVSVSPLRFGDVETQIQLGDSDVDFVITSFDVGHEKPDSRIFEAAEDLLGSKDRDDGPLGSTEHAEWMKIYVGDEYDADITGARNAGWNAILVGPHEDHITASLGDVSSSHSNVPFAHSSVMWFNDLNAFASWLHQVQI